MALPPDLDARVRRLVLENALSHGGAPRPGSVLSRLLGAEAALRPHSAELRALVEAACRSIEGLSEADGRAELERLGGPQAVERAVRPSNEGVFPELPGAVDGKVVLRMAPFPSGALHVGNARMLYVNDLYRERYHGRLLLVFDDTVGSEEKRVDLTLFDVIQHDLELSGIRPDAVHYKSDRLPIAYAWAERLIDQGLAYVCTCPAEELRARRAEGSACPERAQETGTTRDLFRKMLDGGFAPGEAVLRLRTDLHDPDPAFRDRVLCRLSDLDHPRVGRRWKVWPMLEFSWAVDDVELGITHVLRGKDLVIEDRMEAFIWERLAIAGPPFVHWGLLRVAEAKISKSKGAAQVRSGEYDGWADPRLWSIASLDRRGISSAALRRFTLSFGMSLADIEVPAEALYAENRQLLDASTPRRAFVAAPRRVDVEGFPAELREVELANHPDRAELGVRRVTAGPSFFLPSADLNAHPGEEIRLKDLANIRLPDRWGDDGPIRATFTSRENRKLPRLQWVGAEGALPVTMLRPDGSRLDGLGEAALARAPERTIYQFERVGFVRMDLGWTPGTLPVRVCFGHP